MNAGVNNIPTGDHLGNICHGVPTLASGDMVKAIVDIFDFSPGLASGDYEFTTVFGAVGSTIILAAVADGSIRDGLGILKDGVPDSVIDGSIIQALDVPNFEDRGIVEFDISSLLGNINSATLDLAVFGSTGPFPFDVAVFGYSDTAAGSLGLNDWSSGSLLTTFVFSGDATVSLNVTSFLQGRIDSGDSHAGFRFEFANPSNINLNGPFVAFNSIEIPPAATLTVK